MSVNWPTKRLGDLCSRITVGHVGPMANEYVDAGIPFLRSQDILPFRIVDDGSKFITPEFHAKLKKSELRTGDVAIVRTGFPGTAAVVPQRLDRSNCADLVIATPGPGLNPWFLSCLMNSAWGKGTVSGVLVGVAQQHFNVGAAKDMRFRCPPIAVQDRIADILSAYDDLIENNTRRIAILEDMARRLFEEWFGEGSEGSAKVRLGELCVVHRGRSYRKQDIEGNDGLPFVNLKCVLRDGGFRADGVKSYCGSFKESQRVVDGDIIMAVTDMTQERRIVAHSARVANLGAPFGVISMDLVKIEPRTGVPVEFLYALLRWSGFADVVKHHANGANVLHLAPSLIEQAPVGEPPRERMVDFAEIVSPMFALADTLAETSASLRATRDLLLPKLISGEIEVRAAEEALETAAA